MDEASTRTDIEGSIIKICLWYAIRSHLSRAERKLGAGKSKEGKVREAMWAVDLSRGVEEPHTTYASFADAHYLSTQKCC